MQEDYSIIYFIYMQNIAYIHAPIVSSHHVCVVLWLQREHSGQLRVRLSHPAYETELKQLVLAEEERQTEHRQAIQNKRQDIQVTDLLLQIVIQVIAVLHLLLFENHKTFFFWTGLCS